MKSVAWYSDALNGKHIEDVLLSIVETLTRGTQQEEIGKEIFDKARAIFDYYVDM